MLVEINLLSEKIKERSTLLFVSLIIVGVAVLIWGGSLLLSKNLVKQTTSLEQHIITLQETEEEIKSEIRTMESAESNRQLAATVEWAENYRFYTVPLLKELIALLPARGFFDGFQFTSPNLVTVQVQFDVKSDAAYYDTRLKASPLVRNVFLETVVYEDFAEEESTELFGVLPRYIATYSIEFVDDRADVEGAIETTDEPEIVGEGDGAND
ncbi:hypothetical protein [Sporosarcina sp. FA9]|uniref:hypothetical protein n=1 Tax=Sporosarcina sp. FA9 TaxID=3413030 RepID=UPI003F658A92